MCLLVAKVSLKSLQCATMYLLVTKVSLKASQMKCDLNAHHQSIP